MNDALRSIATTGFKVNCCVTTVFEGNWSKISVSNITNSGNSFGFENVETEEFDNLKCPDFICEGSKSWLAPVLLQATHTHTHARTHSFKHTRVLHAHTRTYVRTHTSRTHASIYTHTRTQNCTTEILPPCQKKVGTFTQVTGQT